MKLICLGLLCSPVTLFRLTRLLKSVSNFLLCNSACPLLLALQHKPNNQDQVETAAQLQLRTAAIIKAPTLINYILRSGEKNFLIYVDIAGLSNGWKFVRGEVGMGRYVSNSNLSAGLGGEVHV